MRVTLLILSHRIFFITISLNTVIDVSILTVNAKIQFMEMCNNIQALFFDIDGTLVSFKTHQIPDSTVEAIAKAKERGVGIYISTGRPLPIITNLGKIEKYIDGYITTNGALCLVNDNVVSCEPIPSEDVEFMLEDAAKNDYACIVVGESKVCVFNDKPIFNKIFVKDLVVENIDESLPVESVVGKESVLQLTPFIDVEHEAVVMDEMKKCVSGRWHPAFTDITSRKADKGKGLEKMAAYLNLDVSRTMAFGDGGNDISILRCAGIGVAMGNAVDAVKEYADYATTAVDDDGIRNALSHFGVID